MVAVMTEVRTEMYVNSLRPALSRGIIKNELQSQAAWVEISDLPTV